MELEDPGAGEFDARVIGRVGQRVDVVDLIGVPFGGCSCGCEPTAPGPLAVRANDAGLDVGPKDWRPSLRLTTTGRPTIVVVQQLLLESGSMPVILVPR